MNKRRIRGGGGLSATDFEQITTNIQKTQDDNGNPIKLFDRVNAFVDATQHIKACSTIFSKKKDNCGMNKFTTYGHRSDLGHKLIDEVGDVKTYIHVQLKMQTETWTKLALEKRGKYEKGNDNDDAASTLDTAGFSTD